MSESVKEKFCKSTYERSLLSYCFKSIEHYYTISSSVTENDFLRPEHKLLWVILGTLVKRGVSKFDPSTVIHEAQQNDVLEKIGGYDYIYAIEEMILDVNNLQFYIDKVLDSSTKFQLYLQLNYNMNKIAENAADEDITSVDMLGSVSNKVLELSMKSKAVREATDLGDGLEEYLAHRKDNPVDYCGIKTGFNLLDKRIDGLVPGTLHVICARPKHGKSTFLSVIAAHVAYRERLPVLYIDTEMPFDQWRDRMLSMLSGVPERKVKHGGYTDQEYYNLTQAAKLIGKGKLFHEYMPGYTVDKIVSIYKKYKHVENIGLAVFDYIKSPSKADFKNKKEYQILGDVATTLKDLAGELDVPFLCANQINRQQDIADSDRILRYSDVLMFFKPKEEEEIEELGLGGGTHKLVIRDSRRGGVTPEQGIGFHFRKTILHISEAETQYITEDDEREAEEFEYGKQDKQPEDVGDDASDDF